MSFDLRKQKNQLMSWFVVLIE